MTTIAACLAFVVTSLGIGSAALGCYIRNPEDNEQ